LVSVPGSVSVGIRERIPQICRHDAIVLQNDCAFRPGDFKSAWISRVRGRSPLNNSQRAAGELEDCDRGVFSLNRMQSRGGARLDTSDITKQPKQQIDSVHALIYQCPAAIERLFAAPLRIL